MLSFIGSSCPEIKGSTQFLRDSNVKHDEAIFIGNESLTMFLSICEVLRSVTVCDGMNRTCQHSLTILFHKI
jgi:hypothetical protein